MKVLFVCSGNVFRSLSAEACFNHYVKINGLSHSALSAGSRVVSQPIHPAVIGELNNHGIIVEHQPRSVCKELISDCDLVIAMGLDHQSFLKERFGVKALLFNELVNGKKESIPDHYEVLFENNLYGDEIISYIRGVVRYIHNSIPLLIKSLVSQ